MARNYRPGLILWACVMMGFFTSLVSAEGVFILGGVDSRSVIGHDKLGETVSSMEVTNVRSSWRSTVENLSKHVFRMEKEEQQWPVLKLSQARTIIGIILGGIGAGLASAGGLGGGGLYVPLFNLLLQFDSKTAAALSNFMILGGSFVNLWINLQQHHPRKPHKPLVDFDIVLLMQPNMLLGISIGVIFNVVLPAWLITASLALVLGYMTMHSCKGGLRRWQRETQQNSTPVSFFVEEEDVPKLPSVQDEEASSNSLVAPLLGPEPEPYPWRKTGALILVWLAFFLVQIVRGGSVLGIEKCGVGYWLITATQLPLALVITAWTINQLRHSHGDTKTLDIHEEGYTLGPEAGTLFPSMALLAGVLGGMLGIGGGMIINPLLFSLGMLPQVTAATCASMVFFSSSMSVIQFWLMGRIPITYAVTSGVLSAVFSWVGIKIVHRAVDRYNRASLIVFSVAVVMGVSALLMTFFGGLEVWEEYESGAYMGFHYPC